MDLFSIPVRREPLPLDISFKRISLLEILLDEFPSEIHLKEI